MAFLGNCRATGIGSLPHADAAEAVDAVFAYAGALPYWPQLPRASRQEGMNEQAVGGTGDLRLPGLQVQEGRLRLVQDEAFYLAAEKVLAAYDALDASAGTMPTEAARGIEPFLAAVRDRRPAEAKGQIAGPVTVGMAILAEDGNPILYDDVLREVLVKFLHLRVRWQAAQIREAGAAPVVFVDEPFLASFGTPFFGWSAAQVREVLEAVASGAETAGSHCCSNTDWSIFLESRLAAVSFDAFGFAKNFLVYRDAIASFLGRGGTLAWGIVPTDPEALAALSVASLRERLLDLVGKVAALGFAREQVLAQSLVTPSCGLGSRDPATAQRAQELARDLAAELRREFLGL